MDGRPRVACLRVSTWDFRFTNWEVQEFEIEIDTTWTFILVYIVN